MTKNLLNAALLVTMALASCSKSGKTADVSPASSGTESKGRTGNGTNRPGVITAGEWNDLDNWSFWEGVIKRTGYSGMSSYWGLYHSNRVAVLVTDTDLKPVADAVVALKRNGTTLFTTHTDNKGKAELWPDLIQAEPGLDYSKLVIDVNNGAFIDSTVTAYRDGINRITVAPSAGSNRIEVAFVVDATGSMGDEISYLKTELLDVINKAKSSNPNATLATSSVFYRDLGDEYLTRVSNFSDDINTTLSFIKAQSANGGGDFPEAVHSALDRAVNEVQWSASARARIMFLVLDAPPHHETSVISSLQGSLNAAAMKGIKIIPVTASGIDKETEFLMRFMAMSTNGTYVFITDDSGVGNDHLEATVGEYQVEFLNALMLRLINKYAQ